MPPRFEGLPTASSQAVPLDGCFALILSLRGRGKTAAGAPGARAELLHVLMLPSSSGINCRQPLADNSRKGQRRQQAMRAIVLIPAAVAVVLAVVYLVGRRDDEDDEERGILGVVIDLLSWW